MRRAATIFATLALMLTGMSAPAVADEIAPVKPALIGEARVGETLTTDATGVKYQWLRDGVAIGGTGSVSSYTVKRQDLGKQVSVRITPVGVSRQPTDPTSDPSPPVEPGTFQPLSPKISGETKVGKTLTVGPLEPSEGTVTVLWLRNGKSTGVTGPRYTPAVRDLGLRISARVTQTLEGYTTLVETTALTRAITSPRYLRASTPRIKGTVKLGNTLKVSRGTWTTNTSFRYQWYAGGAKIAGATKKSLTITRELRGRLIRVKVIGSKPKYETRSVLSRPAAIDGLRAKRDSNGWAWPTDTRVYASGYHDGYSIDIASSAGGPIFAPYSGTVVAVGGDGGGVPWVCRVNPGWWRGENQTVIIRHKYQGKTIYSSINHVARDSSRALGITPGDRVRAGDQVATEGMSGCTSGPHTHFLMKKTAGVYWGDLRPTKYIGKPTSRVAASHDNHSHATTLQAPPVLSDH